MGGAGVTALASVPLVGGSFPAFSEAPAVVSSCGGTLRDDDRVGRLLEQFSQLLRSSVSWLAARAVVVGLVDNISLALRAALLDENIFDALLLSSRLRT